MTDHDPEQVSSLLVADGRTFVPQPYQVRGLQSKLRLAYFVVALLVAALIGSSVVYQNRLEECVVGEFGAKQQDSSAQDGTSTSTTPATSHHQHHAHEEEKADENGEFADPKFDRLLEWLLRNGATVEGVKAKKMFAGGGRGVYATRDLKQGELVMTIPSHLWIGDRNAHVASSVGYIINKDEIAREYAEMEGDAWALIMMLEYEKYNPFSFYKPYADFIPKPASPIWWDPAEVENFQTSTVIDKVRTYRRNVEEAYEYLMKHLIETFPRMFSAENNTLDSFAASTITAWTRTFDVSHHGDKVKESALVPMADLLNHKSGTPMTHWRLKYPDATEREDQKAKADTNNHDPSRRTPTAMSFDFHMPEDKPNGEQVVISYSDHRTSFSWIVWAAFIPDDEFGDYITIQVDVNRISPAVIQSRDKRIMLKQLTVWVGVDGAIAPAFLNNCQKILFADQGEEKEQWIKMLEWLHEEVKKGEANLPTSLESDESTFTKLKEKGDPISDEQYFHKHLMLGVRTRFKRIVRKVRENMHSALQDAKENESSTVGIPTWHHQAVSRTIIPDLQRDRKGWGFDGIVGYGLYIVSIAPPSHVSDQ